jgi:enterochelin esterase family protein
VEAEDQPKLMMDDAPGPAMVQVGESHLWYAVARVKPVGRPHAFHYVVADKTFGGVLDMPVFGEPSYLQPGVSSGKLEGPIEHTSKIYDGMKGQYWVYVPAQYDAKTPAAVMVFQDGHIDREGTIRP